jgi:YggT family protein
MNIILIPFLGIVRSLLELYSLAVIIYAVLSLLITFGIVNSFNRIVFSVVNFLASIIDPLLMWIRRVIPPVSGVDFSPLALILILTFLKGVIAMTVEALY